MFLSFRISRIAAVVGAVAVLFAVTGGRVSSADSSGAKAPPAKATELFNTEMGAIVSRDFGQFVKNGTDAFKQAMTKPQFDSVCDQLSDQLKAGYTTAFVEQAGAQGDNVYVWRVTLKSGPKIMTQLAAKSGKVDGFFLKPDTGA